MDIKDVDLRNALRTQANLQTWKLSVLPLRRADTMKLRLVVREKGKPDVELQGCGQGLSSPPAGGTGAPLPVVVSLLPQGGSLRAAKTLSLTVSTDKVSGLGVVYNPFLGSTSWENAKLPPNATQVTQAPGAPV